MNDGFDLDRIGGFKGLAALVDAVWAAGDEARRKFEDGQIRWSDRKAVEVKPDRTPVTEADRAVEARLRAFLLSRYPTMGFLGEESGAGGLDDAGFRWVLDPIDGTRAFVRGIGTWSVLLALTWHGDPVFGIAAMPAEGDLFWGGRGLGAWDNGRPVSLSRIAALEDATVAHGTLQQFTATGRVEVLRRLGERTASQRGFCDFDGYRRLLRGQVDAMVDPDVKAWDIGPAAVLVREAGGVLTSFEGDSTVFGGSALASNGLVHDALVGLLAEV